MLAFFGLHAGKIAQGSEVAASYMPVSEFLASAFLSNVSQGSLNGYIKAFWWMHAIVLLGFLNYLPYSKHMHILAGIPNVFFRSLTKVNTQPREEFKRAIYLVSGKLISLPGKVCLTLIHVLNAAAARIIVRLLQRVSY